MKFQRLVPMFLLALTLPGYLLAGSGPSQKGCGCSHLQKVSRKSSNCGCKATQKPTQKSSTAKCGCGSAQKGKGPAITQKGTGIIQKKYGSTQKPGSSQKQTSIQKYSIQKHSIHKHSIHKSSCGCSACCLESIPAVVVNSLEHVLSGTLQHLASAFACNTCGSKAKSKSGLFHSRSKSKGCGCSGSSKVAPTKTLPDPFQDDEINGVPTPDMEARIQIERRAVHRPVFRARTTARVVRSEPRTLSISTTQPLTLGRPIVAPVVRRTGAVSRSSSVPHNPLR